MHIHGKIKVTKT